MKNQHYDEAIEMSEDGSEIESQESQPQKEPQTKQNVHPFFHRNPTASGLAVGSERVQPPGLQESTSFRRGPGTLQVHRTIQTQLHGT